MFIIILFDVVGRLELLVANSPVKKKIQLERTRSIFFEKLQDAVWKVHRILFIIVEKEKNM